jgi:DNA-binding FadR family transcriptional regulator
MKSNPLNEPRRRKLSEVIAAELMEEIKSLRWPVGKSIGTEAELMARFDVSRATIVEASRQLERHGAAAMRRGSGGGLFVLNSAPAAAARAIATYLELSNITIAEEYEAARVIEAEAGKLAAINITEEEARALRETVLAMTHSENGMALEDAAMNLRIALADGGRNPPVALFMRTLARVLASYAGPDPRRQPSDRLFEHGLAANMSAIVEAAVAGDEALIDHHIRLDVERREQRARALAVAQPILDIGPLSRESANKLGGKIAGAIRNDIVRKGWRPGERLASEVELLERYDVSQWVLRQAIRILELHGIVTMRRGQGGGLFVSEPSPDYTIATAASFLGGNVRQSGVLDARRRLFQSIVQLAALRGSEEERVALAGHLAAGEGADEGSVFTPDAFLEMVSKMGRNRVLGLFGTILNRFIEETEEGRHHCGSPEASLAVMEAIANGDGPLARRRMGVYLRID